MAALVGGAAVLVAIGKLDWDNAVDQEVVLRVVSFVLVVLGVAFVGCPVDEGDPVVDGGTADAGTEARICPTGGTFVASINKCARWVDSEDPPHVIDQIFYRAHATEDWILLPGRFGVAVFWLAENRWSETYPRLIERRSRLHYLGNGRYLDIGAGAGAFEDEDEILPDACTQRVALFDVYAGTWEELDGFPFSPGIGFQEASLLLEDGRLYVHGGFAPCTRDGNDLILPDFESMNSAYAFDPSDLSWEVLPESATPRALHSFSQLNDASWLAIGTSRTGSGGREVTTFGTFDWITQTWNDGMATPPNCDMTHPEVLDVDGTNILAFMNCNGAPGLYELELEDMSTTDVPAPPFIERNTEYALAPTPYGHLFVALTPGLGDDVPAPRFYDARSGAEQLLPPFPAAAGDGSLSMTEGGIAAAGRIFVLRTFGDWPEHSGVMYELVLEEPRR